MSDKEWYDEFFNLDKLNEERKSPSIKVQGLIYFGKRRVIIADNVIIKLEQ